AVRPRRAGQDGRAGAESAAAGDMHRLKAAPPAARKSAISGAQIVREQLSKSSPARCFMSYQRSRRGISPRTMPPPDERGQSRRRAIAKHAKSVDAIQRRVRLPDTCPYRGRQALTRTLRAVTAALSSPDLSLNLGS